MLYTITVNPTIDVTNELEANDQITPGESKTYRPYVQLRHAGGKGIDVSRVIRNLGGRSVAMGFLGGFTGGLVEGLLLQDGLELDFVAIKDETRTNVIIVARDPKKEHSTFDYRFNSPGPIVQPFEFLELCTKVRSLDQTKERKPTHVAICGSLCKDMKAASYVALVRYFKEMGAVVALDTSGSALKEALRYAPRPDIIKPNSDEFYELMDCKQPDDDVLAIGCGVGYYKKETVEQTAFWRDFLQKVTKFKRVYPDMNALITLGKGGMILLHNGNMFHARLSKGKQQKLNVISSVGAGDTALAGLLFELDQGKSWEDGLRTALAAASAAVELRGTESPTKEAVNEFCRHVSIHSHEFPLENGAYEPNGPSLSLKARRSKKNQKRGSTNLSRSLGQE